MTPEEAKHAFDGLKSQGMSDDDLIVALGKMYEDGKLSKDQLGELLNQLGYEFTDEFKGLNDEDSKKGLWEKPEDNEGGDQKPAEDEDVAPENGQAPKSGDDEGDEDEKKKAEEEEKKKAMSLFGYGD